MESLQRLSPVTFPAQAIESELRNGWQVVLAFAREDEGPWLIDLSHRPRWDIQDKSLSAITPFDLAVPSASGASRLQKGVMINRMNRTQASIWHLADDVPVDTLGREATDTTDATVFLALVGPHIFSVTEKLSALDFLTPGRSTPFLVQGPVAHVPCQLVVVDRGDGPPHPHAADRSGAILLTCSRGYAHDMVHTILAAGEEFGMRPAGENRFSQWLKAYQTRTT